MAIAQCETSITLCTGVVEIGVWKAYSILIGAHVF